MTDPNPIDLGDGYRLERVTHADFPELLQGFTFIHPQPGYIDDECVGFIPTCTDQSHTHVGTPWKIEQDDPITLSPSVHCIGHVHGYVRNGKWVPV